MQAADVCLAVDAQIVADQHAAVRPAGDDRPLESQLADHGLDVVRPQLGVAVRVVGLLGQPVPADVHRDQPEVVGEVGVELLHPRQPALRPAMDEQQRPAVGVARLLDVQPHATAASDRVLAHLDPLPLVAVAERTLPAEACSSSS